MHARKVSPAEELPDKIRPAFDQSDVVEPDDVGVIERRCQARLLHEALDRPSVPGLAGRKKLQRDIASQPHIRGVVHIAHPTTGQQGNDAVGPDHGIRLEQPFVLREFWGSEHKRRRLEEAAQVRARRGERVRLGQ